MKLAIHLILVVILTLLGVYISNGKWDFWIWHFFPIFSAYGIASLVFPDNESE